MLQLVFVQSRARDTSSGQQGGDGGSLGRQRGKVSGPEGWALIHIPSLVLVILDEEQRMKIP